MREANSFDIFLLVLLGLIWGSSFFNIKIATYSYEPITLALVRVIFASAPLILLCKFKNIKIEAFSNEWKYYALIGLCNIAIPFILISHPNRLGSVVPNLSEQFLTVGNIIAGILNISNNSGSQL